MPRNNRLRNEQITSPFANTLRNLLESRGVTQQVIADVIGVTRQTISQYVSGKSEPNFKTLAEIANYLGVSVDYLITGVGDSRKKPSAVDDLGISQKVVTWFETKKTERKAGLYPDFDRLLESDYFDSLIYGVQKYLAAARAEEIYRYTLSQYIDPALDPEEVYRIIDGEEWDHYEFCNVIEIIANSEQCAPCVRDELLSLVQLANYQSTTSKLLSLYYGDSERTDLRSYQVTKKLDRLLRELCKAVKSEITKEQLEEKSPATMEGDAKEA